MHSKTENNYKSAGRRVISMVLAIALICSFGLTSVFANGGAQANDSGIKSVTVTGDTNIKVRETTQLTAEVIRDSGSTAEKTVTWSSEHTNIATVDDNGLVTAKAVGYATITATSTANTSVNGTATITVTAAEVDPTPPAGEPDSDALFAFLEDAVAFVQTITESTDGKNVSPTKQWSTIANFDTFNTAFNAALSAVNNATTQDEIDSAFITVKAAYETFKGQLKYGEKGETPAPTDLKVTITYPNINAYVSIDTTDTAKASDYFYVAAKDAKNYPYNVTNIAFATTEKLSEVIEVSQSGHQDGYGTAARFMPIASKKLADGIYNVAMTGVAKVKGKDDSPIQFNVELHINATDPAYLTVSKAIFNVADLNNPAKELTSDTITIKVPSGNEISEVKLAKNDTPYTILDGKWDSAKKEYSFKLTAVADTDGKYKFSSVAPILATFKNQRARMAFAPAQIEVAVRTTDAKLAEHVKVEPHQPLSVGGKSDMMIVATGGIGGHVDKITNFISTPAGALSNIGYASIFAEKAGSATFDVETNLDIDGLFKVSASNVLWLAKGIEIATVGAAEGNAWVELYSVSKIDINNLDTYKVKMEVSAYDKDGNREKITGIKVSQNGLYDGYFEEPTDLVGDKDNKYTFTLELKNKANRLYDLRPYFDVTTASGTAPLCMANIEWDAAGPTSIHFTKDGNKITEDTLPVGASRKYGVVVEGYEMLPDNKLNIFYGDELTIVRGNIFYNEMGTNEQITLRMEKATPKDEDTYLSTSINYIPKVTNPDVKLIITDGKRTTFTGDELLISGTDPEKPTPPTPTPGGGSGSGGSGSSGGGTGTPSVDAPSSNVGSTGEVKTEDIKAETSKAVADAVAATKGATANVTVKNADNITPAALKEMAAAATQAGGKVQLMADSVVNGVIETRLYINPALASTLKAPIKLGVTTNSLEIDATKARFASFANNIAVASFAQQGSFGMKIQVAVKLDLTQLNTKTLVFYSYDKATNKYIPIVAPAYTIDKNGYLHFSTTVGGDIIITDKALVKK